MSDFSLPPEHSWKQTHKYDKLLFYCPDCDIHIPVTAGDIQSGIRLYCPECDAEMEYDHSWKEEERIDDG